jgi:hypothetical protein
MKDNSMAKLGGVCSILLGGSYILVGLFHSLIPMEQRAAATNPGAFYISFNQSPTFSLLEWWALALGALLAFGAVPAISERVRMVAEGWVRWVTGLALLGFATVAMIEFHNIARHPIVASIYVQSPEVARAAIAAEPLLFIDPHGWLRFGVVGLWLLTVNVLAIRGGIGPRVLGYLGIAGAFLYWMLVAGFVTSNETFIALVAIVGGALVSLWYIWTGVLVYRTPGPQFQDLVRRK